MIVIVNVLVVPSSLFHLDYTREKKNVQGEEDLTSPSEKKSFPAIIIKINLVRFHSFVARPFSWS